jgi:peptidoglycan/LPS O-acetylase OafA/YrhL
MTVDTNPAPSETPVVATAGPGHGHGHGARVPALDGVRGLAALTILIYHFTPITSDDPLTARLIRPAALGWVGVDLFFVLSGFLITGILLDAKGRPHYFRNFYARRSLRIFPLYYGTLAALFVVFPLVVWAAGLGPMLQSRLGEYYEEYRYVQSRQAALWLYVSNVPGCVDPVRWLYFMGHFWSLSVEEHFYLIWPAVVLVLNRRRLLAACVGCIALSLALRFAVEPTAYRFFCYVFTPMRLDGLAVGGLIALLARDDVGIARLTRPALLAGAAALGVLAAGFASDGTLHSTGRFAMSVSYTLLAVLFGAFLVLVVAAPGGSVIGRVMGGGFLRFFGKYSYAIYVFNRFLVLPCKRLFPAERLGTLLGSPLLGVVAHIVLGTLVTVAFAFLSWHLFEKHFLKLKVYFESPGSPPVPDEPVAD